MLNRVRLALTVAAAAMAAVVLALALAAPRRSQSAATAGVPAPLAVGIELQRPRPIPPVRLIDERGNPLGLSAWRGKWVILAPSMTLCHEVCPMTTGVLTQVRSELAQAGLSKQVVVAEATVDPWRDTPARLRAYQRLTGADFAMLTGTRAEIHRLWKFFGVYYHRVPQSKPPDVDWLTRKPETFDVAHTDALFFLDPQGQERILDDGMPNAAGHLSRALRSLLSDQGRQNLAHPQFSWSAGQVIDDLYYLMDKNLPASAVPKVSPPAPAAAVRELAGSPGPLAALHDQAGQLRGSTAALTGALRALRGYPVVINAWASWCAPCREEFSILSYASARHGRRIAFLGIDADDSTPAARSFLAQHPVSYPSFQGSSADLSSLAPIRGLPTTIFISPSGKVTYVHQGQYDTEPTLEDDLDRYALGR